MVNVWQKVQKSTNELKNWVSSNYLFTPFFPPLNICFSPSLTWSRKLWIFLHLFFLCFMNGEIDAFGGGLDIILDIFNCICVECVISFNIGSVTLVWFDSIGLVCMKSSTSVVELVMLLCSQVRFYVSSSSHHCSLPYPPLHFQSRSTDFCTSQFQAFWVNEPHLM